MDEAFDSFYNKLLKFLGLKRMPILFFPVFGPVLFIVAISLLLYTIAYKIAGFWRCDNCNRLSWANKEKYQLGTCHYDEWPDYQCEACHIAEELAKKEEE